MKKNILILGALTLLSAGAAQAQRTEYAGAVTFDDTRGAMEGRQVVMTSVIGLDSLDLHRRQMLTITPVLRSLDRTHSVAFAPVTVVGKNRNRANWRAERFGGIVLDPTPQQLVVYSRRGNDSIPLRVETAFEPWMRHAELVFVENVTGCLNETLASNEYRSISDFLPPPFEPTYEVAYATPPAEAVKARTESHTARINFAVGRHDIRRELASNASVLDEVDRIIREVNGDPNLTVNEFHITGYASPEGSAASNMTLSERRAKAFADYIGAGHGVPAGIIRTDWRGDDWDGLRRAMEASSFGAKGRVLDILNAISDPARRKSRLAALGADYRTLLSDYYPALRRNEYTIGYVARPFSVEEARTIIRTKPKQLSLNEMFLVANSYPEDSPEFKAVFDVASRLFPDSDYARLNSAALEIENGADNAAIAHLQGIETPEAWNNIGVVYARQKDYTRAAEYFNRAIAGGSAVARTNLEQLDRWREENPQ